MANPLKISEAASLAFHAMVYLAMDADRTVSNRHIAGAFDASEAHLAKVLRRLGRAGLVESSPGPGGGYSLGRPARTITLQEVYEAVEGPLQPLGCLFGDPVCEGKRCIFGGELAGLDERLREWLRETKLSEVDHLFPVQAA